MYGEVSFLDKADSLANVGLKFQFKSEEAKCVRECHCLTVSCLDLEI